MLNATDLFLGKTICKTNTATGIDILQPVGDAINLNDKRHENILLMLRYDATPVRVKPLRARRSGSPDRLFQVFALFTRVSPM